MADNGRHGDSGTGDPDSRRTLWRAIKRFFDRGEGDQSLRAQLEEVIDEHEEDAGDGAPTNGDLSPIERQMLRNLLHFSEHDADDVAIPRGEIVAIPASASWDEVVQAFAEHGHSRMPVYGETLDEVLGMIHIKDVFPYLAAGKPVLATNIASHTQVMDASCAVLVEPTPPAMAAGIERLAADQALRERLGAAAEDLVQSKYSVAVYRRKVIDEYAYLEHGALP